MSPVPFRFEFVTMPGRGGKGYGVIVLYHVIDTASPFDNNLISLLSATERDSAARFQFAIDRRAYILSHLVMRYGFTLMDVPFDAVLAKTDLGRPFVERSSLVFSLSRTREVVACAFSVETNLGLDVETSENFGDLALLTPVMMTRDERKRLQELPDAQQKQSVLGTWTRKEALLKAIGCGLSVAPDTFATGWSNDHVTGLPGEWHFVERRLSPNVHCALALPRRIESPSVEFQPIYLSR